MTPERAVVLVTDFGWGDPWVAEVKGTLLNVWHRWPDEGPGPRIVDGGHDLPPGDVAAGAWFLQRLVPRFPAGTVFLAVIDPGVGTSRPAVACRTAGRLCVGPGNGLFAELGADAVAVVEDLALAGDPAGGGVSATFHGRDVFAPAAAALALGAPLAQVGRPGTAVDLGPPPPRPRGPSVRWIDRFGNAVTDLAADGREARRLAAGGRLQVGGHLVPGPFATYGAAPPDAAFWYWGSGGTLEIAVPGGRAADRLGLVPGLVLTVVAP